MTASRDVNKYPETYFQLFDNLAQRDEPLEAPFDSKKSAEAFRFRCYNFKRALEHTVNKMSKEERALDLDGHCRRLKAARAWKIKLEGKKLRFVLAIVDMTPAEEQMSFLLSKEKQESRQEGAMTQEFLDSIPGLDELEAMMTGVKK